MVIATLYSISVYQLKNVWHVLAREMHSSNKLQYKQVKLAFIISSDTLLCVSERACSKCYVSILDWQWINNLTKVNIERVRKRKKLKWTSHSVQRFNHQQYYRILRQWSMVFWGVFGVWIMDNGWEMKEHFFRQNCRSSAILLKKIFLHLQPAIHNLRAQNRSEKHTPPKCN